MPFEPVQTDEKIPGGGPKEPDMDDQMLFGCTSFVVGSCVAYLLAAWPMFVIQDTHLVVNLAAALGFGLIPASIWGAVVTRRTGLPGACGFVGGAMAMAIFLYLRLEQLMLGMVNRNLPQPDYPRSWVWILPIGWVLFAVLLAMILLPKREFTDEKPASGRR